MAVGDYVAYKKGRGILHCGCGTYERAVVVSVSPFVLISEWGDMRWSSTVKADDFEKVGDADRKALVAVVERLRREFIPANDQELATEPAPTNSNL